MSHGRNKKRNESPILAVKILSDLVDYTNNVIVHSVSKYITTYGLSYETNWRVNYANSATALIRLIYDHILSADKSSDLNIKYIHLTLTIEDLAKYEDIIYRMMKYGIITERQAFYIGGQIERAKTSIRKWIKLLKSKTNS